MAESEPTVDELAKRIPALGQQARAKKPHMPAFNLCCILPFIFLFGAFVSCARNDQREEAAIYAAYIKAHFLSDSSPRAPYSVLVIGNILSCAQAAVYQAGKRDFADIGIKVDSATERSFRARNSNGSDTLNPSVKFDIKHVFISDDLESQIFQKGGWDEFYRRFPNSPGIITLSKVGFNWTRTQALLYVGHQYGKTAGKGRIVLFEKKKGQWKEVASSDIWVS